MSISALEYDTLQKGFAICAGLLTDLQPKLAAMQQVFDSEGGVQDTLTQVEMDEVAAFSGLTIQQVTDGMYVLTTLLLPAINQGYPSLSQLASRYRGGMPLPPQPLMMP